MLYFNSCPKCQTGAIEHQKDPYGNFIQCLHCGFLRDIEDGGTVTVALARARAELKMIAAGEEAVA